MKRPAFQFYPADWRKDAALQGCSFAARGLWHEMLCVMHECRPYGHLSVNGVPMDDRKAARVCGGELAEYRRLLAELEEVGVLSRLPDGTVYSRRMVKDEQLRNTRAEAGRLGGNPVLVGDKDKQEVNQMDKQTVKQIPTPSASASALSSASIKPAVEKLESKDGKSMVDKTQRQRQTGESWASPEWVAATAKTLGVESRTGESTDEFKDRVYTAANARLRAMPR